MTNTIKLTAVSQHPRCTIMLGEDLQFYFRGTTEEVFYGPYMSLTEANEARTDYLKDKPQLGMFRSWSWVEVVICLGLMLASAGAVICIGMTLWSYFTT